MENLFEILKFWSHRLKKYYCLDLTYDSKLDRILFDSETELELRKDLTKTTPELTRVKLEVN